MTHMNHYRLSLLFSVIYFLLFVDSVKLLARPANGARRNSCTPIRSFLKYRPFNRLLVSLDRSLCL
jgi:hypothetical protein